ncbi:MAG: excinuclease ABC subunit UvrC [Wolbachia endosymbiont of Menacanthus eurysternus]|nr:MAG: excinuclease ABC subunit UvrC [Wolbachia endosymbiont of Menacanthus eurysternus]
MINIQILKKEIESSPQSCGIYMMIGEKDEVLYVGKAKNLKSRLSSYVRYENLSERIKIMLSQIIKIKISITENEIDALLLEAQLIKSLKPPYNIVLKDGKSYSYITISKHDYPKIGRYRGKLKKNKFYYYGPFPSSDAIKQIILSLQKAFLLRGCSDQHFSLKQPCLEYQIQRCSAPCANKITKNDYYKSVKQAQDTLLGRNKEIKKQLLLEMEKYSSERNYELAATYRDRIKFLEQIQMQRTDFSFKGNADFFSIIHKKDLACIGILSFRNKENYGSTHFFIENCNDYLNEKILLTFLINLYNSTNNIPPTQIYVPNSIKNREIIENVLRNIFQNPIKIGHVKSKKENDLLKFIYNNTQYSLEQELIKRKNNLEKLEEFSKVFSLSNIPKRIEVYDNSHISGNQQVGVMIVAGLDGFLKKEYRKFNIKEKFLGDDYKMTKEVLTRRFSNKKNITSDFLLIDGGPGHVSIVENVLKTLNINIPFACMAKGLYQNTEKEKFYMLGKKFTLKNNKVILYLQSLRNEAHRFAISSHRKKRDKELFTSPLNEIIGIGSKRKNALMSHFGSIKNISKASTTEIQNIAKINKKLAETILKHLNDRPYKLLN